MIAFDREDSGSRLQDITVRDQRRGALVGDDADNLKQIAAKNERYLIRKRIEGVPPHWGNHRRGRAQLQEVRLPACFGGRALYNAEPVSAARRTTAMAPVIRGDGCRAGSSFPEPLLAAQTTTSMFGGR